MAAKMGKVIHLGWSTSSDEIPEPISVLMGANLRKNFDETSKKQQEETKEKEPPPAK